MATAPIRKRLISKRGNQSDSSEAEIVIELSDEDTVSSYTTTEDEEQPEPELKTSKSLENQNSTKANDSLPNWADEVGDMTTTIPRRDKPSHHDRNKKRYSSGYSKRSQEDHPMTMRWTHDMYEADDEENDHQSKGSKGKFKKPTTKKVWRKLTKPSTPRVRKMQSAQDLNRNDKEHRHEKENRNEKEHPVPVINNATVLEPVRLRTVEPPATKADDSSSNPAPETPRVRRGLSQASKNQLIATFTQNSLSRPPIMPVERRNRSPSPKNSPVPERAQPTSERQIHKTLSEMSIKDSIRSSRDTTEKGERRQKKKANGNTSDSGNSAQRPASESSYYEPKPLTDQVVSTGTGWAIMNPSVPLSEVKETSRDRKSRNRSQEGRSYSNNRRGSFQSHPIAPGPYAAPNQNMEKVTPVITQSGHMVLLTESGLCVPATQDMFQYQHWYANQAQSTEGIPPNPYYYNSNQYYTDGKISNAKP